MTYIVQNTLVNHYTICKQYSYMLLYLRSLDVSELDVSENNNVNNCTIIS